MRNRILATALALAVSATAFNEPALTGDRDRGDQSRLLDRLDMRRDSEEQLQRAIESIEEDMEREELINRDAEDEEKQNEKESRAKDPERPSD